MLTRFRQYIYVSLLAICFSIACLGEWQSSLDQPQKENSTQSTPNKKFGEFPWYPSSSDWAAIFSGLLFFSTTGLWVVTRTAANAAKKAADVAEQALTVLERPYIFIDAITIAPITQYRLGQPSYVLKNYGKTPAVIRWCEVQAILIDRGRGKETSLDAKQIFNGQLIIGVGESKPLPIGGHIDFTGVDVTSRVD